ncbi:Holliday junction branch migration protein RuvA [Candidatus Latescibacterota bacterium]
MIVMVRGTFAGIESDMALVELSGMTYGILVTASVAEHLVTSGKVGQEVSFHTYSYIEGNPGIGNLTPRLVGFPKKSDLEFFSLLTTVQGLGIRKALRSLAVPVREVARAIELNDVVALKKLPEIGAKTAQKIIVELKGKVTGFAHLGDDDVIIHGGGALAEEFQRDAVDILIQLQYNASEAEDLVRMASKESPAIATAEDLVQYIFKHQARTR